MKLIFTETYLNNDLHGGKANATNGGFTTELIREYESDLLCTKHSCVLDFNKYTLFFDDSYDACGAKNALAFRGLYNPSDYDLRKNVYIVYTEHLHDYLYRKAFVSYDPVAIYDFFESHRKNFKGMLEDAKIQIIGEFHGKNRI